MLVAVGLFVLSHFYVDRLLHLPVPDDLLVFVLFGAIVAYNGYSSVAYAIRTGPEFVVPVRQAKLAGSSRWKSGPGKG